MRWIQTCGEKLIESSCLIFVRCQFFAFDRSYSGTSYSLPKGFIPTIPKVPEVDLFGPPHFCCNPISHISVFPSQGRTVGAFGKSEECISPPHG